MDLDLREVGEGSTRLLVPEEVVLRRNSPVFYNPLMEFPRDVSVALCSVIRPERFCDLLAGSGARGVRIAKELGVQVTTNDLNPKAVELIKANARLNDVSVDVRQLDGNVLLAGERFDYIDIDPFGSPVCFMDSAVRSIDSGGVIAATATDTAALCGSSPRACRRKYDSFPLRTEYYNELGLRILIGFVARSAVRHEKSVEPLFSHCTHHYMRTFLRIRRGVGRASKTLREIGFLQHCFSCLYRGYSGLESVAADCPVCGGRLNVCGPLYTGRFADPELCLKMKDAIGGLELGTSAEALKLIDVVAGEQEVTLPYYSVHKLASKKGVASRTMEDIMKSVTDKGYIARRTHFSGVGLRSDIPLTDLSKLL